jgi:hypothetical protein
MTNTELKQELKKLGLKEYKDIAKITGHTAASLKDMMQPNKPIPRWGKLVLYVIAIGK